MKMKKLLGFIILMCGGLSVSAQQNVITSGGAVKSENGAYNFTIGLVTNQTLSNDKYTISEGIQQPFEIYVVSSIEVAKEIKLQCLAYPNPVTNYLILTVEKLYENPVNYKLFDLQGRILDVKNVTNEKTSISFIDKAPGTYILKVFTEEQAEIKVFKIIKR